MFKKKVFVINITRNRESIGLLAGKEKWRRGASVLREGLEEAETKLKSFALLSHGLSVGLPVLHQI